MLRRKAFLLHSFVVQVIDRAKHLLPGFEDFVHRLDRFGIDVNVSKYLGNAQVAERRLGQPGSRKVDTPFLYLFFVFCRHPLWHLYGREFACPKHSLSDVREPLDGTNTGDSLLRDLKAPLRDQLPSPDVGPPTNRTKVSAGPAKKCQIMPQSSMGVESILSRTHRLFPRR